MMAKKCQKKLQKCKTQKVGYRFVVSYGKHLQQHYYLKTVSKDFLVRNIYVEDETTINTHSLGR
jgi:hypothetical protein